MAICQTIANEPTRRPARVLRARGRLDVAGRGAPRSRIPHDPGDPVLNIWILWWNAQAMPFTARVVEPADDVCRCPARWRSPSTSPA